MRSPARANNTLAMIVLAVAASGCANSAFNFDLPGFLRDSRTDRAYEKADELMLDGQYAAAADHLWSFAPQLPHPHRQEMQIRAADILLDANRFLEARRYLLKIPEENLEKPLLLKKRIAEARFYRQTYQPEKTIVALPLTLIEQGEKQDRIAALKLAADARMSGDGFVEGMELHLMLHKLLDAEQRPQNITSLLNALLYLHPERIKEELAGDPVPAVRPWLELAALATPIQTDREALEEQYAVWQKANGRWEVPDSFSKQLRARWAYLDYHPKKVALLLPITGPYAKAGKAVREGFLSSYQANSDPQFTFTVHNTDQSTDIVAIYKKSVADEEVGMVIGPLLKAEVDTLVENGSIEAPTISLNYATAKIPTPQNDLFQFGLSPEDEALQAARRIWNDEHRFIVVLTPDDAWGKRLYSAFENEYIRLGGKVREVHRYDPSFVDYTVAIQSLFRLDQSRKRHRLVSAALGEVPHFEPRIRDDISASMLFADSRHAIMIFPQMKFHYIDRLPTYATSHVYNPAPMDKGRDLDGLVYCDIPAIIYRENFSGTEPGKWMRLQALGADAEKLIRHLRRMHLARLSLDGQTGRIFIEENRHLFRKLPWARFHRGKPIPLYAM